ncbi:MAG TPA: hypothetical protein VGO91_06845 [Pyrinomonadaceae bacterium]|jgi:hypothetical protein|nr:hypothetical protein [Pyrinomonadaceae bacterium]
MTEGSENKEADRFASGTGRTEDRDSTRTDELRPGVTGGGTAYLPDTGRTTVEEANAANVQGTIGAVGEMDITGAPAGMSTASSLSGASPTGESSGGGPGGGSTSSGGTGVGTDGAGSSDTAPENITTDAAHGE